MRRGFDDSREAVSVDHDRPRELPCRWCGGMTSVVVLATLGARCNSCYQDYLQEPPTKPRFMSDKRQDPRGWARALKNREEYGERLTLTQREMWRHALRPKLLDDE